MAFIHGKNTVVTVDSDDLSAFSEASSFTSTTETAEVSSYGTMAKQFIGGLTDGTFTLSGSYDDGATGPRGTLQPLQIAGAAITVIRQPEGAGAPMPQDSFSAIITSYVESAPVGDKIGWTCDFQITGAIDSTAQA